MRTWWSAPTIALRFDAGFVHAQFRGVVGSDWEDYNHDGPGLGFGLEGRL